MFLVTITSTAKFNHESFSLSFMILSTHDIHSDYLDGAIANSRYENNKICI